jgi:hypothetical protein
MQALTHFTARERRFVTGRCQTIKSNRYAQQAPWIKGDNFASVSNTVLLHLDCNAANLQRPVATPSRPQAAQAAQKAQAAQHAQADKPGHSRG